ncbi:MAG TPA: hypothetical protein VJP78_05405 [Thermoleophilia bacterium]|nr:hypothetical protein [Thermoleophilia bacterium]
MGNRGQLSDATSKLVRFAVWGQLIGYLSFGLSLAAEDSPDIFARASVVEFIWPVVVLAAMHFFRLDMIAGRVIPRWLLVVSVLVISLGTLAASATGVAYAYGIPKALATEGWRYLQATTTVTLAIFAVSTLISVLLVIRSYQQRASTTVY